MTLSKFKLPILNPFCNKCSLITKTIIKDLKHRKRFGLFKEVFSYGTLKNSETGFRTQFLEGILDCGVGIENSSRKSHWPLIR